MKSSLRKIVLVAFGATLLACSACKTGKGFGKDVEKLGDKIQEKAK